MSEVTRNNELILGGPIIIFDSGMRMLIPASEVE